MLALDNFLPSRSPDKLGINGNLKAREVCGCRSSQLVDGVDNVEYVEGLRWIKGS